MGNFEGTLTVNAEVNEDDSMNARYVLADQLRKIADSIQMGFKLEGRIMHPNGHAIGSYALMQTNLPDE